MWKTEAESFFECHAEKFDFSSTELLFVMLDAFILKNFLLQSSAYILRNLHSKAGLVLKNTDQSYAVVILGMSPQR